MILVYVPMTEEKDELDSMDVCEVVREVDWGRVGYLAIFLWPTGDSYRANAELSLEQEQRLRNNLI